MLHCITFCLLSLQSASAPGQCCWGCENCSHFWLRHVSVFLMSPTQGHLTAAIAKIVFCTYVALIFTFAEHLHSFSSLFGSISGVAGPTFSCFSWGRGSLWQGFRQCRETHTVAVLCQAGAEQQGSNLELQLQWSTLNFLLQCPISWTQLWGLRALLVSHGWHWLCLPGQSWAELLLGSYMGKLQAALV